MKNIHVLPTDKPSRLYYWKGNDTYNNQFRLRKIAGFCDFNQNNTVNQNIYITNDEEIKEGDWILNETHNIEKAISHYNYKSLSSDCKKIILTTDQDLIKDGVQAIDDEFLEFFVKNPSCEEVEVDKIFKANPKYKEGTQLTEKVGYWSYKIIIQKKEPKQETLEEAAQRIFSDFGDITRPSAIKRALELANWQQERMFSEEDIINALHSVELKDNKDYSKIYNGMKEWLNNLKRNKI